VIHEQREQEARNCGSGLEEGDNGRTVTWTYPTVGVW
jgi:hypothetical protein